MRLSIRVLLALLLGFSAVTSGQTTKGVTGTISAAEILEKYVAATGGAKTHEQLQSMEAQGRFGLSLLMPIGDYRFRYQAPFSDMLELNVISHGISWSGHHDNRLIRRTTARGEELIVGVGIGIVEQDWRSLLEWDFSREYEKIELIGRARVDRRWAFVLRFTPHEGYPFVRYYDQETFLLVRMDQLQLLEMGKNQPEIIEAVESYFRDYTNYQGVKLPRSIAIKRRAGELQFNVARVQPNAKIDDSVFR